ncbi:Pr6Pr family membrane protein [Microbacterium xanthum]|uniref:Pr6Pr family membrane protein n=1 Tax=Microbacterium xanthum TaxID=3079794 RepID=UPI002AD373FF|nr:Pr6Pr family membrane protein [Microbacterium sp. KSW-48]MDZ8173186.1 Pr6Pr family membrane protein [Microbacterium sp. KSW-48]
MSPALERTWTVLRAVTAALIVAAIVRQLAASVGSALEYGRDMATVIANFFSFFTILSNASSAVVLAWAVVWFATRGRDADGVRRREPRGLAIALVSVTTYMVITGVVYNILLRGVELPQGSEPVPWSNEVLHVVAPVFLLADALIAVRRRALAWRDTLWVLVFPVTWVVYTLVRGPLVTDPTIGPGYWYPYPFLNPNNPDLVPPGYAGVAVYVVGIAAAIIVVAYGVVWVGRRRALSPRAEG